MEYKAVLPGVVLYRNRPISEWHAPFAIRKDGISPPFGGAVTCMNGKCEHVTHSYGYAPEYKKLLGALAKGTKVLALTEYCGKSHVSLTTVDHVYISDDDGWVDLRFKEASAVCHYFTPQPEGRGFGFRHSYQFASVQYFAVVNRSKATAFGKYGGLPCFMRELARVGELTSDEVKEGIKEVSQRDDSPTLTKPFTSSAVTMFSWVKSGDAEIVHTVFSESLSYRSIRGLDNIAALVVPLTQRNELNQLTDLFQGAKISVAVEVKKSFQAAIDLLAYYEPSFVDASKEWWTRWNNAFTFE